MTGLALFACLVALALTYRNVLECRRCLRDAEKLHDETAAVLLDVER